MVQVIVTYGAGSAMVDRNRHTRPEKTEKATIVTFSAGDCDKSKALTQFARRAIIAV